MVNPIQADIISFLRQLVATIQPVAQANFVSLHFECEMDRYDILFQADALINDLSKLLCRVLTFTPQNFEIVVKAFPCMENNARGLCIQVLNTGSYLGAYPKIREGLPASLEISRAPQSGTCFQFLLPISCIPLEKPPTTESGPFPQFFQKLQKSLHHYAIPPRQLEEIARRRSEREGVFLQKVNALLKAHLGQEDFDVNALCKCLALSRTQLYRRLKPLVNLPPYQYIRFLRLSKAKEYLETSEMSVAEVGFSVGFKDPSHFTRVFRKHYGFNPSHYRKKGEQ